MWNHLATRIQSPSCQVYIVRPTDTRMSPTTSERSNIVPICLVFVGPFLWISTQRLLGCIWKVAVHIKLDRCLTLPTVVGSTGSACVVDNQLFMNAFVQIKMQINYARAGTDVGSMGETEESCHSVMTVAKCYSQ